MFIVTEARTSVRAESKLPIKVFDDIFLLQLYPALTHVRPFCFLTLFMQLGIKLSREIIGKVKTASIKNECGKWFVIFTVETSVEPLRKTGKAVGLDVGISHFATLSDGTQIENFKYYENLPKRN